jgi:hypothetical protein
LQVLGGRIKSGIVSSGLDSNIGGIDLYGSTTNAGRRNWSIRPESTITGMLGFWVSADNTTEPSAQVVSIDSSGKVGIGTSSPNTALSVVGGISGGVVTATSDVALPSVATNGYLRLVGQYQAGTGRGGTIQLGGRSYSDIGNVGAFLISGESN